MAETQDEKYVGFLSRDGFLYTMPEELTRVVRSEEENGLLLRGSEIITDLIVAHETMCEAGASAKSPMLITNVDGNKPCLDAIVWMNIHRFQTTRTPNVKPQAVMAEQFDKEQRNEMLVCAHTYGM